MHIFLGWRAYNKSIGSGRLPVVAVVSGNSSRVDALYYGQGLGGIIFDCLNTKDEQGDSLLAKVAGGVGPLSLVRVVLKWGADINSVNNRQARQLCYAITPFAA